MLTIHKYELKIQDEQIIEVDSAFDVLDVQCQRGVLVVWALAKHTSARIVKRKICIHGTGNPISDRFPGMHIGTVQMPDGLVWHVFDKGIT